jgi:hypothetical protein
VGTLGGKRLSTQRMSRRLAREPAAQYSGPRCQSSVIAREAGRRRIACFRSTSFYCLAFRASRAGGDGARRQCDVTLSTGVCH